MWLAAWEDHKIYVTVRGSDLQGKGAGNHSNTLRRLDLPMKPTPPVTKTLRPFIVASKSVWSMVDMRNAKAQSLS